jgi:hypothetical protein
MMSPLTSVLGRPAAETAGCASGESGVAASFADYAETSVFFYQSIPTVT